MGKKTSSGNESFDFKKKFHFEIKTKKIFSILSFLEDVFLPLQVGAISAEFQQKKSKNQPHEKEGVHFHPWGGDWFFS